MGVVVLLLKASIPESIHPWMEMPVALMLVLLGGVAIIGAIRERGLKIHTHVHSHEGLAPHKHIHFHHADEHEHSHKKFRVGRRPFIVGLVHGLAGSAAAVPAVLATIPSVALGLAWIAVFGIGSIAGMLLMSAAIGLPFAFTAKRFAAINGGIRLVAGLASVMFGLWLAWELLGEISQAT
jgi:cytochrome c biogenesis protein CcdA